MLACSLDIAHLHVEVIDNFMCIAETCARYVISSDEEPDMEQDDMGHHQKELSRMENIFRPFPSTTQPSHNVSLIEFKIGCVETMLETMLHAIRDMKLQLQQTAVHISDLSSIASPRNQPTNQIKTHESENLTIARLANRKRRNSI
jgi:hypothetical protein